MSVKNALAKRGLKQSIVIASSITVGTAAIGLGVAIPTYLKIQHSLKEQFTKVANLSGYMTQLMNKLGIPGDSAFQRELAGGYEVVFKNGKTQVFKNENGTKSLIMNTNPDGSISTAAQFEGPSASEMLQVLDVAQKTLGDESDTMNSILEQYNDIAAESSYAIEAQTSGIDEEVLRARDKILKLDHYIKNPNMNFQSYSLLTPALQVTYQDAVKAAADETNKANQTNIVADFPGKGGTILSNAFDAIAKQQKMVEDAKAIASGQADLNDILKDQNAKINNVKDAISQVTAKASKTIADANESTSAKVNDAIVAAGPDNSLLDVLVSSTTRWIPPFASAWGYNDGAGKLKNSSEILMTGILNKLGLYNEQQPNNTSRITGNELLRSIIKLMEFQKAKTNVPATESEQEEILSNFKGAKYAEEMGFFPTQKISSISEMINNFSDTTINDNNKVIVYKVNLQSYASKVNSTAYVFANPYNNGSVMAVKNITTISNKSFASQALFDEFTHTVSVLVNSVKNEIGENTKTKGLVVLNSLIAGREEIDRGKKTPSDFIKTIDKNATSDTELEKMNNYIKTLSSAQSGMSSFLHGALNNLADEYFFQGANGFKFTWTTFRDLLNTLASEVDKATIQNHSSTNGNQLVTDWDSKKTKWISYLGTAMKIVADKNTLFQKVTTNYNTWKAVPDFLKIADASSNYQSDSLRNILFTDNVDDFKTFYTTLTNSTQNFFNDFLPNDFKQLFDIFGQINPDHASYLTNKSKVETNLGNIYSLFQSANWANDKDVLKSLLVKAVSGKKSLLIDDQPIIDFLKDNSVSIAAHDLLGVNDDRILAFYNMFDSKLANSSSSTLLQQISANLTAFKTLSTDQTWSPTGPKDFTNYFNTDDKIFEALFYNQPNIDNWMKNKIRLASVVASSGNVTVTDDMKNQITMLNNTTAGMNSLSTLSPSVSESLQKSILSLVVNGHLPNTDLTPITMLLTSADTSGALSTDAKANKLIAFLDSTHISSNLPLIKSFSTAISTDLPNASGAVKNQLLTILLSGNAQAADFTKAINFLKTVNDFAPVSDAIQFAQYSALLDETKLQTNLPLLEQFTTKYSSLQTIKDASVELKKQILDILVAGKLTVTNATTVYDFLNDPLVAGVSSTKTTTAEKNLSSILTNSLNTTNFDNTIVKIANFDKLSNQATSSPAGILSSASSQLKMYILWLAISDKVSTSFFQDITDVLTATKDYFTSTSHQLVAPLDFAKFFGFDTSYSKDNLGDQTLEGYMNDFAKWLSVPGNTPASTNIISDFFNYNKVPK